MLKPYKRGTKLPERLQSLYKRFNPSQKQIDAGNNPWVDVHVDTDPDAVVIATGIDAAGRFQRLYSVEHVAGSKSAKFERVRGLLAEWSDIRTQLEAAINDPETSTKDREAYLVAYLIYETGIRPGGAASAKGENSQVGTATFGATTLKLKHVKPCAKGVRLQFVGKKGVDQNILVTNPYLVEVLLERKAKQHFSTKAFNVSSSHLCKVFKSIGSGVYTAKDVRTAVGTSIALDIIGSRKRWPTTKKGRKQVVNDALDQVSRQLGNTRAVAKNSYIDPQVLEKFVPLS